MPWEPERGRGWQENEIDFRAQGTAFFVPGDSKSPLLPQVRIGMAVRAVRDLSLGSLAAVLRTVSEGGRAGGENACKRDPRKISEWALICW